MSGLIGLAILMADIWAIVNVFGSRNSMAAKVVWTAFVLIMPVLGFIIWMLAGPRSGR